jgi:hypothetical protein
MQILKVFTKTVQIDKRPSGVKEMKKKRKFNQIAE